METRGRSYGSGPWIGIHPNQGKAWLWSISRRVAHPQGRTKLLVLCTAFVTDCLETLEEIFLEHGGVEFHQPRCLKDHPKWIVFWLTVHINWVES